jgi:pyruvate dehydrogenase E2 component (dihydrolipoamide acetyltransferase)
MEEGNIVEWLKKEGDPVAPGDILAEVETDKATMELESYFSGTLLYIGVKEGLVPVDGIIAIIGDAKEDYKKILAEADNAPVAVKTNNENGSAESESAPSIAQTVSSSEGAAVSNAASDSRVKASPLAKRMAEEAGLDIGRVSGTGDNGRIIKKDIEAALTQSGATGMNQISSGPSVLSADVQYGSHPVSQMRKTIARRLSESKFGAPHFYLTMEIDMGNAVQAREQMNTFSPVRISYNDMIVKACATALQMHPAINASWTGDAIVYHEPINIGIAVAIDDGLMVPVLNNANFKSLSQIKVEVSELANKAKDRKLGLDEMQGNTFTISNLGMFEIEEFTAIINPPDSCILAVGAIIEKPVVRNGAVVPGHMMKITLSCDHRIVDGATGAQFLQTIKQLLQEPYKMLV